MEKDGLFLKNIHVVPEKVSNGSVERPKTNTSYKTKALIYFTFFAFFCLKKVLQSIVRRWNMQSTGCLGPDIPTKLVALISPIGGVESSRQGNRLMSSLPASKSYLITKCIWQGVLYCSSFIVPNSSSITQEIVKCMKLKVSIIL